MLVNNAGKSPLYDHVSNLTEAQYDSVLDLNLKGPFRLMALVGTRMAQGAGGSIINISSIGAIRPGAEHDSLLGREGGAERDDRRLRARLRSEGARELHHAGLVPDRHLEGLGHADVRSRPRSAIALRRGGEPNEIVGAALYFASDASSYTTGSILTVDGGVP